MFRWLVRGCFSAMCRLRQCYRVKETAICSPRRSWGADTDCKCTCITSLSLNGQRQVRIHGFNTAMWSPSENRRSAVEMKPWVAVAQRKFIYKGIEGQDGVLHLPLFLMNECTIIQHFCMARRLAYYTCWLLQHLLWHEYDIFKWCTNKLCTNLAFNFTTVTWKAANSLFNTFKSSPK